GSDLNGRRIALWGLAFKPATDDMREAPSLVIIDRLLAAGASIFAYDPEAMQVAAKILGDRITFVDSAMAAAEGADALVVVTEWNEFRNPDLAKLHKLMASPRIFDGRNIYDPPLMAEMGFEYQGIGRA
ncbi:MAG: UDP-glucose 6-dehydrogenase, partial [Oligoflexia bacterium]|nr:UDP-glucose 6-dehydrogenase [Oligoflexia bacterium]